VSLETRQGVTRGEDGWMDGVSWHFKHTNSRYIMPEIVQRLLAKPMACIKEIIRLEAV